MHTLATACVFFGVIIIVALGVGSWPFKYPRVTVPFLFGSCCMFLAQGIRNVALSLPLQFVVSHQWVGKFVLSFVPNLNGIGFVGLMIGLSAYFITLEDRSAELVKRVRAKKMSFKEKIVFASGVLGTVLAAMIAIPNLPFLKEAAKTPTLTRSEVWEREAGEHVFAIFNYGDRFVSGVHIDFMAFVDDEIEVVPGTVRKTSMSQQVPNDSHDAEIANRIDLDAIGSNQQVFIIVRRRYYQSVNSPQMRRFVEPVAVSVSTENGTALVDHDMGIRASIKGNIRYYEIYSKRSAEK